MGEDEKVGEISADGSGVPNPAYSVVPNPAYSVVKIPTIALAGEIDGIRFDLTITVTDREIQPGCDLAVSLGARDIGPERAGEFLGKIREAVEKGQIRLTNHAARILGLPIVEKRTIRKGKKHRNPNARFLPDGQRIYQGQHGLEED